MKNILVLGIGNYLMGDEGVGVHLAESLLKDELPSFLSVLDGGTGGFHLLEYFEKYDSVILVDATLDENNLGRINQLRPRFATDFPRAMSTHDIGMKDLIAALQLTDKLTDIHLFTVGISINQMQGILLSPTIENVMPELKKQVLSLAYNLNTN